jgi:hypothetical protein
MLGLEGEVDGERRGTPGPVADAVPRRSLAEGAHKPPDSRPVCELTHVRSARFRQRARS